VLDLTGYHADASVEQLLDFRRDFREQRQNATHVKATDEDRNTLPPQLERDIGGAAELVTLYTYQADDYPLAVTAIELGNLTKRKFLHRFVERMNPKVHRTQ
jgi:hypothetical protein